MGHAVRSSLSNGSCTAQSATFSVPFSLSRPAITHPGASRLFISKYATGHPHNLPVTTDSMKKMQDSGEVKGAT